MLCGHACVAWVSCAGTILSCREGCGMSSTEHTPDAERWSGQPGSCFMRNCDMELDLEGLPNRDETLCEHG